MSVSARFNNVRLTNETAPFEFCMPWFVSSNKTFRSACSATPPQTPADLINFLALVQELDISILPISWQQGLGALGSGASGDVQQALVTIDVHFAFKGIQNTTQHDYQALMCELAVLCHPQIQRHPNILQLLGICWDVPLNGDVKPVLVFEKAHHGSLDQLTAPKSAELLLLEERLMLCGDIAKAVMTLHSHNVVHGDIKPQNVLLFKDSSRKFIPKVADFGYSTMAAGDDEIVLMPRSEPWNAPEHHDRGFTLQAAKKMDVYSLGLLCFWVIFEREIRKQSEASIQETQLDVLTSNDAVMEHWIESLAYGNGLLDTVMHIVKAEPELTEQQKSNLTHFFSKALVVETSKRSPDVECLIGFLESTGAPLTSCSLEQADSTILDVRCRERSFKVSRSFEDFIKADFRVRKHMTKSLRDHFYENQASRSLKEVAFELAFCYEVGFGVPADDGEAKAWLDLSDKQQEALQVAIDSIQVKSNRNGNPLIESLYADGYLAELFTNEYANSDPKHSFLRPIKEECQREIADLQRFFPKKTSYPILYLRLNLLQITRGLNDLEGAAEMAEVLYQELCNDPEYGAQHNLTLSAKENWGSVLREQGKFKEVIAIGRSAAAQKEESLGKRHMITLISIHNLALALTKEGELEEAETLYRHILDIKEKDLGVLHPEALHTANNLGSALSAQARFQDAEALHRRAFEGFVLLFGPMSVPALTCANNLAGSMYKQGKTDEALEIWQKTLASREVLYGPLHRSSLDILSHIALVHKGRGDFNVAEDLNQQVLQGRSAVLGRLHPDTIISSNNLALTWMAQGKYAKAEDMLRQALSSSEEVLGSGHFETTTTVCNLGTVLLSQSKFESAVSVNRRALENSSRTFGEHHPTTLACLGNLAAGLNALGRSDEAEEMFERVVQGKTQALGADHASTLVGLSNLAMTLMNQGKLERAESILREILEKRSRVLGANHPATLKTRHNLATVLYQAGKHDEARENAHNVAMAREIALGSQHPATVESQALYRLISDHEAM